MLAQGFSLIEVLISLCFISITSLAFLTQQWQVGRLNQDIHKKIELLLNDDNAFEQARDTPSFQKCLS
jgi:prepilin-type N-terminal cleavage/methylation domain-containing protein